MTQKENTLGYKMIFITIFVILAVIMGFVELGFDHTSIIQISTITTTIGLGLYYFESIRDIKEIEGYEMEVELNKESISNMSEKINEKSNVVMKEISNNREKIIEDLVLSDGEKLKTEVKDEVLVNPQELINF